MRRRIYWLLPDLESARATMDDLLLARIEERHIRFVAREGSDMSDLHAASVLETSDVVRSAEMGLILGAGVGALLGALVAVHYPIIGDEPQWGLAGALAVAGALFGTWASTMIGISTPSKRLTRFMPQIEQGQLLLMVDVPVWRVQEVEARLLALHPEAHLEGTEPDIPAFP
ncbi:MAG: putative transrane protein [Ramlibacter sp.]|jgi:hypothetical protein|uniref:DUF1269 domain-containing protein n=1 Tax=Ramlibacter sp. TaxID=1917967 RepID=UPI002622BC08|nr:DUF1269 domain-containing protein [Ramlibacter sp.]MDB5752359.1 putative transrane protein [Ramlibacter sp.]